MRQGRTTSTVVRRASLGLAQQALAIRNKFPASRPQLARGRMWWRWTLQPTETSRAYGVVLVAREGREASVFVERPELRPNEQGLLPHVYENGALCLNRQGEWQPRMLFTDTFIPWTVQWLFFYEVWKATDVWRGDGPEAMTPEAQSALLHPYRGPKGVDSL